MPVVAGAVAMSVHSYELADLVQGLDDLVLRDAQDGDAEVLQRH
jgi:hypothetical protein